MEIQRNWHYMWSLFYFSKKHYGLLHAYKTTLKNSPEQLIIGINDTYTKGGDYKFLKEKHRLTAEKIVEDVFNNYNK